MKVVAFNGSPRKGGNTEILLQTVLAELGSLGWETELVAVGGQPIRGCVACNACARMQNLQCVLKDDLVNDCIQKMVEADAIVLGSPTYFAGIGSDMKALLDRAGYVTLQNGRVLAGKIGAAVAAVRRAGSTQVFDAINHLFSISGMIIPGSLYWNLGVGHSPGEVNNDAEALRNMRHLGKAIHWLGKATVPVREHFPKA